MSPFVTIAVGSVAVVLIVVGFALAGIVVADDLTPPLSGITGRSDSDSIVFLKARGVPTDRGMDLASSVFGPRSFMHGSSILRARQNAHGNPTAS